ncbi:AEC family transporter [Ligilactobacillus sp. WILCCON 0076]|uniref:AEC family transporter n=1 Tax=Ligilactobacillus ubinensis TaxID=2876789 RepID=A0A9X2FL88_9LACO|nr:AEC family transporter [Ligilactobacillus ubinensis]MCP0886598.1 AEC family transporter [Ligilactobacillus ubinensis]
MSVFFTSIQSVLAIVMMIAVGYFAQAAGFFGEGFSNSLSKLIMKISLPLAIFNSMLNNFNPSVLSKLGTGLIYVIISIAIDYFIAILLTKMFRVPRGKRGLMIQGITGANTVFIGMPLNTALFGTSSIPYLLVYYIVNTIVIWTIGVWFIANDDPTINGKNKDVKFDLSHLLPVPLYGFIAALPFIYIEPLKHFYLGLSFLSTTFVPDMGALVTPLSLIYIGIMLRQFGLKNMEFDGHIVMTLIGRFILSPIIMVVVVMVGLHAFGISLTPIFQKTLIIQSATPTLAVLPIMANEYHGDVKYATNVVVSSSILFVIVVPIIMMLQSVL